jgi:trigger factor
MEYNIEEISPVKRKVTVTVPAEEVDASIMATTALYRADVEVKGFRKGKAPSDVIEAKYGKRIYDEATQDLINMHINEIMGESKILPMGGLDVDADRMKKGQDFVYSITFEVAPPIELPDYKGVFVQVERAEVNQDEVDQVLERIRGNMAEMVTVEESRKPVDGDVVTVSFAALGDEEFEGVKADNFQLTLGEGQALPEFEEIVKTLKPGEKGEKRIDFPKDFINEKLAGRTADMRVHLESIQEKRLPEIDDELAKKAGLDNLEALRETITNSYRESRESLNKSAAQKRMLDRLMEGIEISLPQSLVDQNIDYLISDLRQRLERRGRSLESLGLAQDELREEQRPAAEDLAGSQLFLLAVASQEGLTVDPGEVEAVLRESARRSGQDFEQLRQYYEQSGMMVQLKDRLLADKAMELIWSAAEVTEVEPGTFDEEAASAEETAG